MVDVICVGAGISGSLLGHLLKDHMRVLLVDKSRGPGGRMSTRRIMHEGREYKFDHGAQFFTARSHQFKTLIDPLVGMNLIKEWHSQIPHASYSSVKESTRFCGTTGMNSLAKFFSSDVECHFEWQCTKISNVSDRWILESDKGEVIHCRTLVVAIPATQALRLFSDGRLQLTPLSQISYQPTWAVMLGATHSFRLPPPHAAWFKPESGIEWVSDNQKKGISTNPSLTIHLTQQMSLNLLQSTPEQVIDFAKAQLQELLPTDLTIQTAHRWLLSRSSHQRFERGFYQSESLPDLYFIGDAFEGGRVEGAALSAIAAAKAIKERYS